MKKTIGCILILFLLVLLVGVVMVRSRSAVPAGADLTALSGETEEETQAPSANSEGSSTENETGADRVPEEAQPEPIPEPVWTPPPLREPEMVENSIPEELFEPAEHKGSVKEVQYSTRDRVSELTDEVLKDAVVYLPYGYDPESRYDVLILLHCAWEDHRFWLIQDRNYGTEAEPMPVSVPNLLDRMIETGYCEPMIVVSPCVYLYDRQPSVAGNGYDYMQFAREFGPDFLRFVAENYATYAADGSREALSEAREHFGVLGASFGAYASYISVIVDNFDLVAWYTYCGGGAIDPGYLLNGWAEHGTSELPLKMLYICEGEHDDRAAPELSFHNLLYIGEPFTEENVKFTLVTGWGHEDHSYLVGVYNSLQLYFRDS